jgi:hypothetical protein
MMRSRGTRTNAHSPFAQRQSAVGEAGCGDAPQPVKLAKTARINAAHIMVMSRAVVCVDGAPFVFPAQGIRVEQSVIESTCEGGVDRLDSRLAT